MKLTCFRKWINDKIPLSDSVQVVFHQCDFNRTDEESLTCDSAAHWDMSNFEYQIFIVVFCRQAQWEISRQIHIQYSKFDTYKSMSWKWVNYVCCKRSYSLFCCHKKKWCGFNKIWNSRQSLIWRRLWMFPSVQPRKEGELCKVFDMD